MGKKGAGDQHFVVDYHISSHLGFCVGPVDAFKGLWFKDEPLRTPINLLNYGRVEVNEPALFGGTKKEGGVAGTVLFMPGYADQKLPPDLASRIEPGSTPDGMPGFRNICTLGFIGNGKNGQPGFYVSSNYPQVPAPWARFSRSSKTLGPSYSIINKNGWALSNPMHMIHECLVSDDFGMGGTAQSIDHVSFMDAARVLFNEGFGLAALWTRSARVESFIQEILDHINAMFFFNPRTGLATIKLLRDDYDIDDLDTIGPDTAKMISFRRKLWGETTNEIVVNWTNPETGENDTVTFQDLANIAMQGEVVSEPRNYDMICDADLAAFVGSRDIFSASMPTATAVIECFRHEWKRLPGDVVRMNWPKYDAYNAVMRVMSVDYGENQDAKIRVTLMEDVFSLGRASYAEPPVSEWTEPGSIPTPAVGKIISVPKPLSDILLKIDDADFPRIMSAVMLSPVPYDVRRFILNAEGTQPNGDFGWMSLGDRSTVGAALTRAPLVAEVETTDFVVTDIYGGLGPSESTLGMIGDGHDTEIEWVMFDKYLGDDRWKIARGIYDTVPQDWPAGTMIRILTPSYNGYDLSERFANSEIEYRIQPISMRGTLPFVDAPPFSVDDLPARPHLPFRPANVKINGQGFGVVDMRAVTGPLPFSVTVSWANRNRNMEDSIIRRWHEGDVPPEAGQTTEIIVKDMIGNELARVVGLVGNSYELVDSLYAPHDEVMVHVISRRDGLASLQGYGIHLKLRDKGWSYDYGYGYGGWEGYE